MINEQQELIKQGKLQKPLRCKLGFHKYGKWSTYVGSIKTIIVVGPRLVKKCELCGRVKFR